MSWMPPIHPIPFAQILCKKPPKQQNKAWHQTINVYSSFFSLSSPRDRAQTCYADSQRETPDCINQRRWRVRLTLAEGWSRTHPSPFNGLERWVIIEKIYLTHFRKALPFGPYFITLQDLSAFLGTSVWLYMPVCPLAVPSQIYRSTYQWFTWIYPPTTGGAPPWNNILPGTTNAANNYQTFSTFSTYSSNMIKKVNLYELATSCVLFWGLY